MAYFGAYLSVPLKSVMSEPMSEEGGGGVGWTYALSIGLVGEGDYFSDGIRMIGSFGIVARFLFGICCFMGILLGYDNELLHFFFSIFLRRRVSYVYDSCHIIVVDE